MAQTFCSINLGTIQVEEQSIFEFPAGMPGFEDLRLFTLIESPEQPALLYLHSLERADVCFLAMPVKELRPGYELVIAKEDLDVLGPRPSAELAAFAVLSLVEGEEPTANLLSPVVLDLETKRGMQAIRPDSLYTCREPLVVHEAVCS